MVVSEKRIEDLKGLKFNVPSYQRGYRWTEHEVTTLLEDLYTHSKQNRDYKYCLQPLIVKKVSDNTYSSYFSKKEILELFSDFNTILISDEYSMDLGHGNPHYHGIIKYIGQKN